MAPVADSSAKRARPSASALASSSKGQHAGSSDRSAATRSAARRRPRLFQPFRALGLVTDHVPFVLTIRHGGKDATKPTVNIVACIGTSWTMWDADRMVLLFVGEPLQHNIAALAMVGGSGGRDSILAASGHSVHRFVRGRRVQVFDTEGDTGVPNTDADRSSLSHITHVGDNLIALSSSGSSLFIWSLACSDKEQSTEAEMERGRLLRRIALDRSVGSTEDTFCATSMVHPSTYVDKVLLGSTQGHLQLYNFRTAMLLHTFTTESLLSYMGMASESLEADESLAVVDLVQTPAVDVVAVVFAAGYVLLLDIRYDEPITYARVSKGDSSRGNILARSSVSFRTDSMAHTMAVGTRLGDIILFDLEIGEDDGSSQPGQARPARLAHTMRAAHDSSVASIQFVQGQPLLISSGSDNAIKQWFFEVDSITQGGGLGAEAAVGSTTAPRLLKSREGHSAPPRLVRYAGEGGKTILSAGGDDRSVRAISVVRDSRSAELSQGSLQKKANQTARPLVSLKLPPTTSLSHSSTRTRDWDDLLTTHSGVPHAQPWSLRNQRVGKNQLASTSTKSPHAIEATVSCVSVCGNFAMVGNTEGYVEMYNIQSGRYRRRFDTREVRVEQVAKRSKGGVVQMKGEKKRLRGSPVTGIVSDSINKTIAISTMNGDIYFFNFSTAEMTASVSARAGISALLLHRPTNLVAAIQDDLTIALYDMETFKMVRLFAGFGAKILDATFSPDGRWLITTSLDSFVRTFDIPTSRLVDYFFTKQVATSVTFSPLGDFLATTHVASRGVFLWANRNQYLHLALSGIDEDDVSQPSEVEETLPSLRGIDIDQLGEEDAGLRELDVGEGEFQRTYTSKPQLFLSENNDAPEGGLVTLSTMPRSRWMSLLNLDVIKARNKPKEAPKKPEKAPFFLPVGTSSVPDSAINKRGWESLGENVMEGDEQDDQHQQQSRRLQTLAIQGLNVESDFSRRLAGALQDDSMDALFLYLHTLSPPALDAEIRSLVRLQDITRFLHCMTRRLEQHRDFDAVQAMVAVALRVHGDVIVENGIKNDQLVMEVDGSSDDEAADFEGTAVAEALRQLMAEQYRESNRVLDLVQYCVGTLAFVRDMPLV